MAIKYIRVFVTPEMAQRWIERNAENNRRPKNRKINQYGTDMLNNDWNEETGQTIKFSVRQDGGFTVPDGPFDVTGRTMLDGQNRMFALRNLPKRLPHVRPDGTVITEFKGLHFDVAYDVPEQAMMVMDTGAARTFSDTLSINVVNDRPRAGSLVRWILAWEAGQYKNQTSQVAPTHSMLNRRFSEDVELFDAAIRRGRDCQRQGLGPSTPSAVAYFLFSKLNNEQAQNFFDLVVTGANIPLWHPAHTLRSRLFKVKQERLQPWEQLVLYIRAWNAYREDRTIQALLIVTSQSGSITNENFPQPK